MTHGIHQSLCIHYCYLPSASTGMTHGIHQADTDECGGNLTIIEMFPKPNEEKVCVCTVIEMFLKPNEEKVCVRTIIDMFPKPNEERYACVSLDTLALNVINCF